MVFVWHPVHVLPLLLLPPLLFAPGAKTIESPPPPSPLWPLSSPLLLSIYCPLHPQRRGRGNAV